ncbi:hypothetical protein ACOSQ4_010242 [Xanthoceras sorbifolium]
MEEDDEPFRTVRDVPLEKCSADVMYFSDDRANHDYVYPFNLDYNLYFIVREDMEINFYDHYANPHNFYISDRRVILWNITFAFELVKIQPLRPSTYWMPRESQDGENKEKEDEGNDDKEDEENEDEEDENEQDDEEEEDEDDEEEGREDGDKEDEDSDREEKEDKVWEEEEDEEDDDED